MNGAAGDVLGYGMRGGKLFVKGNVGYRVGIHMKSYKKQIPVIIAGGTARDFLGEYMAGGIIIILGLDGPGKNRGSQGSDGYKHIIGNYAGTGMHGGRMYIRGKVEKYQLGSEVDLQKLNEDDYHELEGYLKEYCSDFDLDLKKIMKKDFVKLSPHSSRPYGELYCY